MKRRMKNGLRIALALLLILSIVGCQWLIPPESIVSIEVQEKTPVPGKSFTTDVPTDPAATEPPIVTDAPTATESPVSEDGTYDGKDDVALYLHLYGHLPSNYITKDEAKALGWSGGSVERYAPGKCIGGDRFGNYEKLLPDVKGRTYRECDIDTLGKSSRGAKRIIYSNDGCIYYTDDHYESFTLLYGGD